MLTEIEREYWDKFLDDFREKLGNSSCNDFSLPNTPEHQELLRNIIEDSRQSKKDKAEALAQLKANIKGGGKELFAFDTSVFSYLRAKVETMLDTATLVRQSCSSRTTQPGSMPQ